MIEKIVGSMEQKMEKKWRREPEMGMEGSVSFPFPTPALKYQAAFETSY